MKSFPFISNLRLLSRAGLLVACAGLFTPVESRGQRAPDGTGARAGFDSGQAASEPPGPGAATGVGGAGVGFASGSPESGAGVSGFGGLGRAAGGGNAFLELNSANVPFYGSMGLAGPPFGPSGRSPSRLPWTIWFSSPERGTVDQLTGDLRVMQHILERNISSRFRADGSEHRMGIQMLLNHRDSDDDAMPVYIEGFGAVFYVNIDIPLIGPQNDAAKPEPQPPAVDSEWERARAELTAPAAGRGDPNIPTGVGLPGGHPVTGMRGPTFDAAKVEQLKRALVRALRNGANLRGVQPNEWIVVVITGAPDSDSLTMMQQSAIAALKKDPINGWPGAVPTTWWGAGRSTVMTIRIQKADTESIPTADSDSTPTQPKSLSVTTYYGSRTAEQMTGVMMMPGLSPPTVK